jgi:hypothetical protein
VGSPRRPAARTSTLVDRFRAAQQINPACGCYYDHVYWITFAGMATTDDPRYVIGVMMDNPATNADGAAGPLGAMRWITSGLAVSFDEEFRSTVAVAIDAEQFDQFLEGAEHRQAVVDNMVTDRESLRFTPSSRQSHAVDDEELTSPVALRVSQQSCWKAIHKAPCT